MFAKTSGLTFAITLALGGFAVSAMAQSTTATPVTTRPSGLTDSGGAIVNDSELSCLPGAPCAPGATGSSTVVLNNGGGPPSPPPPPPPPPSPPPPTPPITCTPGVVTAQRQSGGSCPAGTAAYTPYGGSTFQFTQTRTQTEACPAGIYGAPSYTYTAWTPATAGAPGGCGYPSGTGVQIGVNNQANFYGTVNGTTGSYPMGRRGGNPGGPLAQFSGTWTWNGQTVFVQVKCGGPGETELCNGSLVKNIGGVNWTFTVWGSSLLRGDCMLRPGQPWNCPLNGAGSVGAQ